MAGPTKQAERHVDAVIAALAVLDCFLAKPVLGVKEIMDLTGFTRNRVMRLTGTLLHYGALMPAARPSSFTVGPKCLALGKVFEQSQSLVALVRPLLKQLVMFTGEGAFLYIRDGLTRRVLAKEEGTHNIRYTINEGERFPLLAGSASKVIAAFSAAEVREALVRSPELKGRTARGTTRRADFLATLDQVRQQGYAVSAGERIPDAFSISAPIFGGDGELIAAVSVGGPITRFTPDKCQLYLNHLLGETEDFPDNSAGRERPLRLNRQWSVEAVPQGRGKSRACSVAWILLPAGLSRTGIITGKRHVS